MSSIPGDSPPVIHVILNPPPLNHPGGGRHFVHIQMPAFVFAPHPHPSGGIGLENRGFCQIPFFPPMQNPSVPSPGPARDQVPPVTEVEPANNNTGEGNSDKQESFGKLSLAGLLDFSKLAISGGKKSEIAKKLLENLIRQFRINSKPSDHSQVKLENKKVLTSDKKNGEIEAQKGEKDPSIKGEIKTEIAASSKAENLNEGKSLEKMSKPGQSQSNEASVGRDNKNIEGLKERSIDVIPAPAASIMHIARDVHQLIKNNCQEIFSPQDKKECASLKNSEGTEKQVGRNESNNLATQAKEIPQGGISPGDAIVQPTAEVAALMAEMGLSLAENEVANARSSGLAAVNALRDKRELEGGRTLFQRGEVESKNTEAKTNQTLAFRVENDRTIPLGWRLTLDELMKRGVLDKDSSREGGAKGKGDSHRLMDILFMILCAVVCGSRTIEEISAFVESREKWFTVILGLRNGVPGHQLIWRLLTSIDFKKIDYLIKTWIREVQGGGHPGRSVLPMISIWQTSEGLIFGQEHSESRSVALNAMQNIIELFDMKHTLSMISSSYPLSGIVESIAERGGRSLVEVDGEDSIEGIMVIDLLKDAQDLTFSESYIEGRERMQVQEKAISTNSSLSQVIMEIFTKDGPVLVERFFSSNITSQGGFIFELLRAQRAVERKTDWLLNISMRSKPLEDVVLQGRENLISLRRYAIELVTRENETPGNIQQKQALAARNEEFLLKLLKI